MEVEEDRISALADSLILRILSFLPKTEDAARTSVLSKRWQHLWAHVPVLNFHHLSHRRLQFLPDFANFVDKTLVLHSSSRITTVNFVFDNVSIRPLGHRMGLWILCVTTCRVEELTLRFNDYDISDPDQSYDSYLIPHFFYENDSLRKLETVYCDFVPPGRISWKSLRFLDIGFSRLSDELVRNILEGCPLLESLELFNCQGFSRLDIASRRLKRLEVCGLWESMGMRDGRSKVVICCPFVVELGIIGICNYGCELVDASSVVCAKLDFCIDVVQGEEDEVNWLWGKWCMPLLGKVYHCKTLTLGFETLQVLSKLKVKDFPAPSSECRCLVLEVPGNFFGVDLLVIASLLHSLPKLEKLVLDLIWDSAIAEEFDDGCFEEPLKMLEKRLLDCLPHLRTVEICGFGEDEDRERVVFKLIEILLKSAKVLEKMHLRELDYPTSDDVVQMTKKVLSFPRSSPYAQVLVLD